MPGTNAVDPKLLEILVCPVTKGTLRYDAAAGELVSDGSVLGNGFAPLLATFGPAGADVQAATGEAGAGRRQSDASGVQGSERDLQAATFTTDDVALRHHNVGETNDAIVERLQSHEAAAVHDLDSGPIILHHEGCRRVGFLLGGSAGHDHDERCAGAVGAPEFFAIEDEVLTVLRRLSDGSNPCRIRADFRLR
jgi:uncharacterized protein YbaR (Trm112 family)